MNIILGREHSVIKKTIDKTEISKEFFESVLKNNGIYSKIDWTNGSPKLKYNGENILCESGYRKNGGKYEEYQIATLVRMEAKDLGHPLTGSMSISLGVKEGDEGCSSAYIKDIYFITEKSEAIFDE